MRISEMNWMQVEAYLKQDDRVVVPIGSTEQHAYLSLSTDSILAERVAAEAAEPLGVPVFPVVGYGITPNFRAYPGTISLRIETHLGVVRDVLDGLAEQGFRRVLIVNGHGGNSPAGSFASEWMAGHPGVSVRFHDWWNAPRVWQTVLDIDPSARHASWMESFDWTRVAGAASPDARKPEVELATLQGLSPAAMRERLGDGNCGGHYRRSDEDMARLWRVAVEETRELIAAGWP